jgi:hypothetical protein
MDTFATRYAFKKSNSHSTRKKSPVKPPPGVVVYADEFADESPTEEMINKRLPKSAHKRVSGKVIQGGKTRRKKRTSRVSFKLRNSKLFRK